MKIKLLAAVLIWVCGFRNMTFAQKEHYVWYFGDSAGVDFNTGSPVALTNGSLNTLEGCASISDGNGNLLFYTDGRWVWDRNHNQMANGDSLGGGYSSTQSALIVPFPANNTMFYIFTVGKYAQQPLSYSIVDMTLNSGNGDVTIKNFLLNPLVAEKLCGVKHLNNSDVWVMVHGYPNDSLFAYLVTASGVTTTPVVTKIGTIPTGNYDYRGYMKFSADGNKLANAVFESNYVDLFDFDASTGILSTAKHLTLPPANGIQGAQGIEFSLTGQYLYAAQQEPSHIFQWDISSNNAAMINSTLLQIGSSMTSTLGALQMAPDGKIYVAEYYSAFLGVINSPDSPGVSCNYVDTAVFLAGKVCQLGLPNFISSYSLPTGLSNLQFSYSNFQLYPNPATDKIYISFPATASENITIKIFSITGEVVLEQKNKCTEPITKFQLPVFNISNGIYFLSVQTGRGKSIRKIVVNH